MTRLAAHRARAALLAGVLLLATLTACTPTVPMQVADDAANPLCAEVSVRLPKLIDAAAIRATDAQATAAWGNPARILLTCGVAVPGPSTARCVTIAGVDWLVDDSNVKRGVFTTFGRNPAVQVVVDHVVSDSNALNALSDAVGTNRATGRCLDPAEVSTGGGAITAPKN
ncbi:MAG: DUF3515 domain-containing protein [Microbacteriaceae bacterium]|nr:DUF3515 domain-containing protein [Microbacteriaceae bacterium]